MTDDTNQSGKADDNLAKDDLQAESELKLKRKIAFELVYADLDAELAKWLKRRKGQ